MGKPIAPRPIKPTFSTMPPKLDLIQDGFAGNALACGRYWSAGEVWRHSSSSELVEYISLQSFWQTASHHPAMNEFGIAPMCMHELDKWQVSFRTLTI